MKRKKGAYRAYRGREQVRVKKVGSQWEVSYRNVQGHWSSVALRDTLNEAKEKALETLEKKTLQERIKEKLRAPRFLKS